MPDRTRSISDDLRAAYDGLPHPAVILDRTGLVRYVNPRTRELASASAARAADEGIPWEELLGSPDPSFGGAFERVMSGRATRIDLPRLTAGDSDYRVRLWRSGDGWIHAFFLATDPEDSEDGRRARGERVLLDAMPDLPDGACYVFDDRLRYVAAYGRDVERDVHGRARVIGRTIEQAWPDEVVGRLAAPYLRALSGRESDFIVRWDGRVERHRAIGARDSDGGTAYGVVWVRDVTESVTTEESLRRVGEAVEALPMGVTLTSSERGAPIVHANAGFLRMYGHEADEVMGRAATFMFGDEADRAARDRIEQAILHRTGAQEVLQATRADGSTFWDRVTLSPVDGGDGAGRFVVVHEDVSTHRRTGEAKEIRRRLDALGGLAGGIAHDMRNLLAGTGLAIELLVDDHDLPEQVLSELRNIHDRLSRGTSITDRLLSFARDHTFERDPVDLRRFVEGRAERLRGLVTDTIQIRVDAPDGPSRILGNERQLDQVLVNLAKNAERAMPDGGVLELEVRAGLPRTALEATPPADEYGDAHGWALLRVRDHGIGMADDVRRRAFEPFFSAWGAGDARGLGLATVFGVVERLGGVCWIESEAGRGSTVCLAFPQIGAAPRASSASRRTPDRDDVPLAGVRILLADDDRTIRLAFTRFLELRGAEVDVVPDGAAGRERLRAAGGDVYDLLVTDAVMPNASGQTLIEEARRLDPDIGCILMSGHTRVELPAEWERVKFLEKPFSTATLSQAIREVLPGASAARFDGESHEVAKP